MAVAVGVGVTVAGVAVGVAVEVAVAVGVGVGVPPGGNAESIYLIVIRDVDASASNNASVPFARAGHQFVGAAARIDNGSRVTVVTM